jgi:hypothetical protein
MLKFLIMQLSEQSCQCHFVPNTGVGGCSIVSFGRHLVSFLLGIASVLSSFLYNILSFWSGR